MSSNDAIAARLGLMAQLLELTGADKFRILAHQKAARVVEAAADDLAALARQDGGRVRLLDIDGIGPKMADKIIEFATTGRIREVDELAATVPPGLVELLGIPGLGPKTVHSLWKDGNVTDLAALERILADGTILTLPRMGEKAAEKIRAGLALRAQGAGRVPLGVALPVAERVLAALARVPGVGQLAFAGSLRRGRDTIGDLDILATAANPAALAEAFCTLPGVGVILARGENKCSVRLSLVGRASQPALGQTEVVGRASQPAAPPSEPASAPPSSRLADSPPSGSIQVDLRIVPDAAWGAALMYFTGSKEHNVRLRERALKRGLTLNEYGLFPEDPSTTEPPQRRGIAPVAGRTEHEVYTALGLPFIPPELREDRGELDATATPPLVELKDIRAELHAHTTASDGRLSIAELADHARRRGFHTLAVTDHSQSSAIAGGLKPDRLRAHAAAIRAHAATLTDLRLLVGSEVDILADGRLDYDDETLALLDLVVASPHASLTQDPDKATARLVRAVSHPRVHILGHPTGRLVQRRTGLQPDLHAVIAAALKHNVALEINAHWHRLDLRDTHVKAAIYAGCLIAINTDAHDPEDFDNLRYGILTARRGGVTPDRCINCWPPDRLAEWLASKRPPTK